MIRRWLHPVVRLLAHTVKVAGGVAYLNGNRDIVRHFAIPLAQRAVDRQKRKLQRVERLHAPADDESVVMGGDLHVGNPVPQTLAKTRIQNSN